MNVRETLTRSSEMITFCFTRWIGTYGDDGWPVFFFEFTKFASIYDPSYDVADIKRLP